MSINSRSKGKAGEREFFNLMNRLLGTKAFTRNLTQTRGGGEDGETDLPVAVEVKRQENLPYPAAIRQAKRQAADSGKLPVLAHRRNREGWTVMLIMTPQQFAGLLKLTTTDGIPRIGALLDDTYMSYLRGEGIHEEVGD